MRDSLPRTAEKTLGSRIRGVHDARAGPASEPGAMNRIAAVIAASAALSLLAATPALAAKTVNYKGRTTGGHTITFKRQGNKVWWISTMAPTTCLPTNRPGARIIGGAEIYTPPGYEIVGKKV